MTKIENIRRARLQLGWTVEFINLQRRNRIQFTLIVSLILGLEALRFFLEWWT